MVGRDKGGCFFFFFLGGGGKGCGTGQVVARDEVDVAESGLLVHFVGRVAWASWSVSR